MCVYYWFLKPSNSLGVVQVDLADTGWYLSKRYMPGYTYNPIQTVLNWQYLRDSFHLCREVKIDIWK